MDILSKFKVFPALIFENILSFNADEFKRISVSRGNAHDSEKSFCHTKPLLVVFYVVKVFFIKSKTLPRLLNTGYFGIL